MAMNQSILFLKFLLAGIILGAIIGLFNFILLFFKNNKIVRIILDLLTCLSFTFIFIHLSNTLNMGRARLYLLCAEMFGIIIERITIGKVFAKLYKWLYNKLSKFKNKLLATKFGKFINY